MTYQRNDTPEPLADAAITDQQLLELAAKAEGRPWKWITCPRYGATKVPGKRLRDEINGVTYWPGWNPLEDDGDALRLAVKCNVCLSFSDNFDGSKSVRAIIVEDGCPEIEIYEGYDDAAPGSKNAATRRAIVRAVAAIAS